MLPLLALAALAADDHLYWGAIHEHTGLSRPAYGFGPDEVYRRMIDADLDFGAVTDYDWALAQGRWDDVAAAANRWHCPAGRSDCYTAVDYSTADHPAADGPEGLADRRFVTLLAYEWNNNHGAEEGEEPEYGHRNVYLLRGDDPEGDYVEGDDETCDSAQGCVPCVASGEGREAGEEGWADYTDVCTLWESLWALQTDLPDLRFFTVAHHPALSVTGDEGEAEGGRKKPTSTDWSFVPEDCPGLLDVEAEGFDPLVEVYSVWGSSEHVGMPLEEDPSDGLADDERVVREAALGGSAGIRHHVGLVAAGDTHTGYPGEDPHHSFLLQPDGEFRNYDLPCAAAADCDIRFGHTGLVAVRIPDTGGDDLTREAVFDALAARHTVATTGERFDLRLDLVVDDEVVAVQGDDVTDRVDVGAATSARFDVSVDLGAFSLARIDLVMQGDDGSWIVHSLEAAGPVSLVEDGDSDWLPDGAVLAYLRVQTAPVPAIVVEEEACLVHTDAEDATLAPAPGRYTGNELAAAITENLPDVEVSFAQHRFTLDAPGGLSLETSTCPALARALGLRDDQDTPACAPCTSEVPVDGGTVTEQGWTSPIWFTHQPRAAASEGDHGTRCGGCGKGSAAVVLLLGAGRRRRWLRGAGRGSHEGSNRASERR